ncbi:MAG TPA: hypothetical protein VGN28_05250 [Blastococcus sp.]|nr:hypothetical protein [Blastococcus sp.]
MRDFSDEVAVLSRRLGRDVAAEHSGGVPVWSVFRFRDAAVFAADVAGPPDRMYLVRGSSVREFVVSQGTIDGAYAGLQEVSAERAVA